MTEFLIEPPWRSGAPPLRVVVLAPSAGYKTARA
jgi:hypothetical protein